MAGYPVRYIVFDTETNVPDDKADWTVETLRFRLGVAKWYDPTARGNNMGGYCNFTDVDDFHRLIAAYPQTKEPIWIFAHNIGFDLRIIKFFEYLSNRWYSLWAPGKEPGTPRFKMPLIVMENPPTIIKTWRPDGQEVMWSDTFQWINMSLQSIGKNMGIEKGKMPPEDAPLVEWFEYCRRDVDVLDTAMRNVWDWLGRNRVRDFQPTRAGQARYIYKHQYENKRICYPEDDAVTVLDRLAYYGGRTDLWHVGAKQGPIHQLDINSLYPYVMREKWYPVALVAYDHTPGLKEDLPHDPTPGLTAEVYLDSPDFGYPVRCREGTWFVRGKVRTILPGPELKAAWDRGHVSTFGRFTLYHMGRIFKEFVDDYWRMRQEAKAKGDKVSDLIIKLLMNSLYGKFGQLTGEWDWHDDSGGSHEYGEGIIAGDGGDDHIDWRMVAGHVFYRRRATEARGSFIPIAAYVTSYARCLMDRMREIVGPGNYYYQATDSLYVNDLGLSNVVRARMHDDSGLGRFKKEATYDQVTFRNIHNMDKGDKRVRGSVKEKAREIGPDCFEVVNWESFSTAVIRGNINEVVLRKMHKRLNPVYKRQRVLPDGSCVPWTVDNWDTSPEDQAKKPLEPLDLDTPE